MGLLELYNQISSGSFIPEEGQQHIDNMPLGNPQWDNPNDNVTDYGNTNQITGKITPGQYPAGPIEHFTQSYNINKPYLDQVYTNPNNNQPSPNQDSLDASRLDDQNNPNPDPTEYPVDANSLVAEKSGEKYYSQEYSSNEKYDTTISDSPLARSLDGRVSSELNDNVTYTPPRDYIPDELIGTPNFTPEYNSDSEYDANVGFLEDGSINSPLSNSLDDSDSSDLDDLDNYSSNNDPTIYPIEAQSQGTAAQKYEQKYYNPKHHNLIMFLEHPEEAHW